jgi:hypothetical protein
MRGVQPGDVVALSELLVGAVRSGEPRDWRVQAGTLEWDVETTLAHVATSLGKYAIYVASGVSRYIPLRLQKMAVEVTHEDWLQTLAACSRAFATVAASAPEGARAFHAAGMADVEGYVALACAHVMEHGYDVAQGLRVDFDPPKAICAAVNARLAPWAPAGGDAWRTFLWRAGRIDLPGRPPVDPATLPALAPLAEWDGTIPTAPDFPVAAHVLDPETHRWTPVPDVPNV